jgi:hypothetical protein
MRYTQLILAACSLGLALIPCGCDQSAPPARKTTAEDPGKPGAKEPQFKGESTGYDSRKGRE